MKTDGLTTSHFFAFRSPSVLNLGIGIQSNSNVGVVERRNIPGSNIDQNANGFDHGQDNSREEP